MSVVFPKYNKRESAVDVVLNAIKEMLVTRQLRPGDKLPTENEICDGLGVSRGSVREAMKILSAFGLIDIRVGNGTYVCDTPGNQTLDSFLFSFFALNPHLEDMREFRHLIEVDILQLILTHRAENEKAVQEMRQTQESLRKMIDEGIDPEELLENDLAFHYAMADASCNVLASRVYRFTIDFLRSSIASTHEGQNGEIVYRIHEDILDVIENNDADRVEQVIRGSVRTWSDRQPEQTAESEP